jgi:hypothetical protein
VVGEHHEGDFGVYMAHKRAKLASQFLAAHGQGAVGGAGGPHTPGGAPGDASIDTGGGGAASEGGGGVAVDNTTVFRGVRAYVNGYTLPPLDVLKVLLGRGGGMHDHYLSGAVTHVVAQNLPDSKIKEIRAMKRRIPVVLPAWIVDSARAGSLQPIGAYLLPAFRETTSLFAAGVAPSPAPRPRRLSGGGAAAPAHAPAPSPGPSAAGGSGVSASGATHEEADRAAADDGAGALAALVPPRGSVTATGAPIGTVGERHAGNDPLFLEGYFRRGQGCMGGGCGGCGGWGDGRL